MPHRAGQRRLPLSDEQIEATGAAIGGAMEERGPRGKREFWLRAIDLTPAELNRLGQLSLRELTALNLQANDRHLFNKLKALVEVMKHYPKPDQTKRSTG